MRRDLFAVAACRSAGVDLTGLFFSEDPGDLRLAKSVCAGCPVAEECLTAALARGEPAGVWGGQELKNGQVLARHRRRGRPGRALVGVG
jgi:WhiB family transcriptional regulator, redox-sensing transcriptional regulator